MCVFFTLEGLLFWRVILISCASIAFISAFKWQMLFVFAITLQDGVSVQYSDLHYFPKLKNVWSKSSLNALYCVPSVGLRAGNQHLLLSNTCEIHYIDESNVGYM